MADGIALTTAGITVKYAAEASAGVRPTTGYVQIPDVKSIPAIFDEPNTAQSTTLEQKVAHTYVKLLKDSGGAIGLTVNDTAAFRSAWTTCVSAHATAAASGLRLWFEFAYEATSGLDSFYMNAEPAELGYGGADVDGVLENTAQLIPNGTALFATAST